MTMRYLVVGVAAVLLIATLWTSLTQVNAGERGVVHRFGRVIEVAGPGLYIGLPWGIDRVERVAVDRLRRVTVGYSEAESEDAGLATPPGQLLTGDHNLVNIRVVLDYAVDDKEVEQFVLYGDRADGLVARMAEAVLAEWTAGRPIDEVILTGKVELPIHLVAETQKRVTPYQLGVQIKTANVTHLLAPKEVKAAFDDVSRAHAEVETKESEAKQEADRLVSEAKAYKNDLEKMASARAGETFALAEAQARAFTKSLETYHLLRKENPNYLASLWWDEMSRLYARMRQTGRIELLDHWLASDGFDILQMPLIPKKN
jgi:membrane protease subunit HflK